MDYTAVNALIESLAQWRATEQAASQDVEDADAKVVAADVKFQEAKRRLKCIEAKVSQIQTELADLIIEQTEPDENVFAADGEG
jgi:fructose-specific phosphotransferase system component IIB